MFQRFVRGHFSATLYNGDCLEILPSLAGIDAVITDPPYNFESKGGGLYRTRTHLDTIRESFGTDFEPEAFFNAVLPMFGKNLIVWFSQKLLPTYLKLAEANGLGWDLMYWHKPNAIPNYNGKMMSDTELCLRLFRPGESFIAKGLPYEAYNKFHLFGVQSSPDHPTPKPIDLMIRQVKVFADEGSLVCDPFTGSGTTGVACLRTGRNFIGIEKDPKYFASACSRLEREANQGVLL